MSKAELEDLFLFVVFSEGQSGDKGFGSNQVSKYTILSVSLTKNRDSVNLQLR